METASEPTVSVLRATERCVESTQARDMGGVLASAATSERYQGAESHRVIPKIVVLGTLPASFAVVAIFPSAHGSLHVMALLTPPVVAWLLGPSAWPGLQRGRALVAGLSAEGAALTVVFLTAFALFAASLPERAELVGGIAGLLGYSGGALFVASAPSSQVLTRWVTVAAASGAVAGATLWALAVAP